jgi:hypothetical protein
MSFGAAPIQASETEISLSDWELIGSGFTAAVDHAVLVSEYPGSAGVMLVSPYEYGNEVAFRFDIMPLNPETVLVVMLAASQVTESTTLSFPEDYDGGIGHLLVKVDSYFFAFHNAAHNRTPFVRKHPILKGAPQALDVFESNVMTTEWHHIDVTTTGHGAIEMKIDGETVLSAVDKNPLPGGKVILRLRGTKTHTATALIRDLKIDTD